MSLTVAIVAYDIDLEQDKFQLGALANQTCKDFDLLFIDPHRLKERFELVNIFFNNSGIESVYMPYNLPPMPRWWDWAVWNTPFCITRKERVFRFQQWRVITSDLIEQIMNTSGNIAFQRNDLRDPKDLICSTGYTLAPQAYTKAPAINGWYGNGDWCMTVEDFLEINGIDEVVTTLSVAEDMDMSARYEMAYRKGVVSEWTVLGNAMLRAGCGCRKPDGKNTPTAYNFCVEDPNVSAEQQIVKNRTRCSILGWRVPCPQCIALGNAIRVGKNYDGFLTEESNGKLWHICKCNGVTYTPSVEPIAPMTRYIAEMEKQGLYKAPIGVANRFGRNLRAVRDDCLKSLNPVETANESWFKERYLYD